MTEHAVVIAGGGPTGLMLAGELALAGVDVAIVERRPNQNLPGSRAGGLQSRTIEVLDQRGIADRFLAEGQVAQVAGFGGTRFDISDFPTRHPYGLGLWQKHIERILAGWVRELKVPIHYGTEVTGFAQDDTGVDVALSDGRSLRAQYLVGCDGGRSLVRKAAGIDFPGWDPTTSSLLAEVEMTEEPELGVRRTPSGTHALGKVEYEVKDGEVVYQKGGTVGVMLTESEVGTSEPTLRDLSEGLIAVYGTDYGIHDPTWITRFTDVTRQAAAYREGRVLLAGDAAHVHSPVGGQGLNTGVQDAVNLGWKLAQVVHGTAPESLLDTYHAERHPVAARVLRNTMAQVALMRPDDRIEALRDVVSELLSMDEPRTRFAAMMSGLDIHYDLGEGHPLLGRRMPDLDLVTADGPLRVFTLLHDARPVLLNLGEPGGFDITPWADRVQLVDADVRRHVGASGTRGGHGSHRRADPARRIRGVGGRRDAARARRRAHDLVRTAWLGQRRGGLPQVGGLEAFGEGRVDRPQLLDEGRPLGSGHRADQPGQRTQLGHPSLDPARRRQPLSPRDERLIGRARARVQVALEDEQLRHDQRGRFGPAGHLDRRRHQRQSFDRPARLAARPGVDDEEHRPEDRRRDHPLVARHPRAERGQPGVDLTDPDLRRTQQARPDRGPDPEVVLVGDLDQPDRPVEHELRLASPQVEQAGVEPGERRRPRVPKPIGQGDRRVRTLDRPIRQTQRPEREGGGRVAGDPRIVAEARPGRLVGAPPRTGRWRCRSARGPPAVDR